MKPLSSCTYAELKERAQKRISELDDTDGYTPGPIIYAHAAGYALAAADLPTALCQLEILADRFTTRRERSSLHSRQQGERHERRRSYNEGQKDRSCNRERRTNT